MEKVNKVILSFLCLAILGLESCSPKKLLLRANTSAEQMQSPIPSKEQKEKSSQLFPVTKDGKRGYIDSTGKMIIKPEFDGAGAFQEGRAAIAIGGKLGYIDKTGQIVIEPQFNHADRFVEGLAAVRIGNKTGYIDKNGKVVIPPQFDISYKFSEGLARVAIDGK